MKVQTRREFWKTIGTGAVSAGAASVLAGCGSQTTQPPNIVLVMTDDQGYGDIGAHGNPVIQTPSLDRLHGESVRLTNFHVDPLCAPTRSALMTGRYSVRTGAWATVMGRSLLRRDEVTMADVFAANGYQTGIFGKWHLGDNYPFRPQDHGFGEAVVHGGGGVGQTPDFWGNDYFDDSYYHNGTPEKYEGYCTDVFFNEALRFIEANQDRPFFAYIPTNAPHGPYLVAESYSKPYLDRGMEPTMAAFYGMITNIDENVGRLRNRLEELGLEDNTILIFMTDNGTAAGVAREDSKSSWKGFNAGMRERKGSAYDGGHRVPCFIRWPAGGLASARDISRLSAHIDLLPTLIELGGLQRPVDVQFDGASLVPLLRGSGEFPERTLFVQQQQRQEFPERWSRSAVMTERWRLVDGEELYDIVADPGQTNDVAAQNPKVVAQLREAYEQWYADVTERAGEYNRIVIGAEQENPARITCHDWHDPLVPWNQRMIEQAPEANGYWAVEVARGGRYEFTLRQQPVEANFPIDATTARLKIGDVDETQPVGQGATAVTFTVELKPGETRLETWFTNKSGRSRGAFLVYVRYLS